MLQQQEPNAVLFSTYGELTYQDYIQWTIIRYNVEVFFELSLIGVRTRMYLDTLPQL